MGELESSQEEADTRLILHAKHAADTGYQTVIVISEDTDVFVLLLSFAKDIPPTLYQKRGTKTRTQFVDISYSGYPLEMNYVVHFSAFMLTLEVTLEVLSLGKANRTTGQNVIKQ